MCLSTNESGSVTTRLAGRINIVGQSRQELVTELQACGIEPFRADQLWNAIYVRGITDFSRMPAISQVRQRQLAAHFTHSVPQVVQDLSAADGTRKWLLQLADGRTIESVFIPEIDCGALCVSSQVGCALACSFCHTGTMGLERNLTVAELVGQVMIARNRLAEWGKPRPQCLLTNIVLMGMGEPLLNFENVARAIRIISDGDGIAISRRRIMLSTAGVVPLLHKVAGLGVNLAVSLHSVRDELRDELVPLNRKYPIAELLQACRTYPAARNARRITFEYVMLKDVNDSDADARELVRLLTGIPAKVNLIPWNPWPGSPYAASTSARIQAFASIVNAAGYSAAIRATRGEGIMAACGQLKSGSEV